MTYVRPAWIAGHHTVASDQALALTEAALLYARGQAKLGVVQDELLKMANECRAEIHYRASQTSPVCDLI